MRKPAASTWPPSLVSASISKRSSSTPTAQMSAPAISTMPASRNTHGSLVERNGSWRATTYAVARPPSIASPPRYGMGTACTSRSRTFATAPVRSAISRAITVNRYVAAAATRKTRRYSRMRLPGLTLVGQRRAERFEHLVELLEREGAAAQHPALVAGDVDDRGGLAAGRGARVDDDRDLLVEHLEGLVGVGGGRHPGLVGRADRERA